ncbi:family 43 glycosylhydrolase [Microbacterium sp. 179-I 3D2 NHS]|uniref:family 43 glycosylhydrolase n=1 Tax=Microbacterium sp. 179-I 3D2 NHS TaxID=3235178 RepID=UPI0039A36E98
MEHRSPARRIAAAFVASAGLAAGLIAVGVPATAAAPSDHIANDTVWSDTAGNQIKAQGGNVLRVGDTYYWVGIGMDPQGSAPTSPPKSINLYSSSDLENWTFVRALVSQWDDDLNDDGVKDVPDSQSGIVGGDPESDLAVGRWLGRPQLVQHPDGRFILTAEVNGNRKNSANKGLGNAVAFFEASNGIDGDFEYQGRQYVDVTTADPDGVTRGDGTLFVDGADAYMVYVADTAESRNAEGVRVAPLSDDWLTIEPNVDDDSAASHEAPSITKIGSTYYMFASGKYWWDATDTYYRTSTDVTDWQSSTWKKLPTNPLPVDSSHPVKSFGTQFAQIFPVVGDDGTTSYLYNGDRYSQFYGPGKDPAPPGVGRNAWYPVTFDAGTPTLHGATDVWVDADAGTLSWNPVANGRFDQGAAFDTGGDIPQWKVGGTAGAAKVQDLGAPNNRQLKMQASTAFTSSLAQQVSVANGDYRLQFDVKSSAGFNAAYAFVKNHGGSEQHVSLNTAAAGWTTVTVDFTVSTKTVRYGFWADGPGGKWLAVDNVKISPR